MQKVGYARLSTLAQESGSALDGQVDRLRDMGCNPILIDGESEKAPERPQYNRLLNLIASEGRDLTVVVTRLDRLTRSLPEFRRLVNAMESAGTTLIALDDNVDLSTSAGKLKLNMLCALAETEPEEVY